MGPKAPTCAIFYVGETFYHMASLVKRLFSFDRALLVSVIALAWPTVLQELLTTMVQYADTAMVGQLGPRLRLPWG